jgi:hypothetical protein
MPYSALSYNKTGFDYNSPSNAPQRFLNNDQLLKTIILQNTAYISYIEGTECKHPTITSNKHS